MDKIVAIISIILMLGFSHLCYINRDVDPNYFAHYERLYVKPVQHSLNRQMVIVFGYDVTEFYEFIHDYSNKITEFLKG